MTRSMMLSRLCSVNTGSELPGLSLPKARLKEGSQAETLPLAHGKNSDAIMHLQKGSSLFIF